VWLPCYSITRTCPYKGCRKKTGALVHLDALLATNLNQWILAIRNKIANNVATTTVTDWVPLPFLTSPEDPFFTTKVCNNNTDKVHPGM